MRFAIIWVSVVFLGLGAAPVGAIEVARQKPEEFRQRSREDPDRLFALIVGATWCQPCHHLVSRLEAVSDSTSTISHAAWDLIEVDAYGEKRFADFIGPSKAATPTSFPMVVVMRGGRLLGFTTVGADVAGIARFLVDIEHRTPGAVAKLPQLLCPRQKDDAAFTWGISGYLSENDASTDAFGAANLLAFHDGGGAARLFAPSTGTAAAGEVAPSETGYFIVDDPLNKLASNLEPAAGSTIALQNLPRAPRGKVRLIVTGHGGPGGLVYGYTAKTSGYNSPNFLDEPTFTAAIHATRLNGHEVRGLVLTCYGGQFGEAFMPTRHGEAPACAAFSSLPEKSSEGCYRSEDGATRRDYLFKASRLLRCPAPGDGRVRHYDVVLSTGGHDIPMLSSEYFLLYGPGADFLGRGERAPAPSRSIARFKLASGVEVYVDLIGGTVLKATKDGRAVPLPRMEVVDCQENVLNYKSLDGQHASASFARSRIVGPTPIRRKDCSPVVALVWDDEEGEAFPTAEISLSATKLVEDHYREDLFLTDETPESFREEPAAAFARVFGPQGPEVSLRGLKKEARVLIRTVLPGLAAPLSEDALVERLNSWATELHPANAPLSEALKGMVGIWRRDNLGRDASAEKSSDAAVKFSQAIWRNIAPGDDYVSEIATARLAHLAAAARAELTLRREAESSPRAKKLLRDLDSLQACERGLY